MPWDPCLTPLDAPERSPAVGAIRVVEVLATGTNGGAQEHLFSLVTRLDPARYDVSVVALSAGSAVRKLQRAGVAVLVIDDPDDAIAVGALAAHLAEVRRRRRPRPHVPRRDRRGRARSIALGEAGQRRPYLVATVHSSRVRSEADRAAPARADAADGPAHRGLEGDRGASSSTRAGRPSRSASSTTASTSSATTTRSRAARCPRSTGWSPARRSSASSRGWSRRRATRRCSRPGRPSCAPCPDAYLLIVGEGSRRDALEAQARELRIAHRVVFTGRRDDVPAVTAALDVAVLPSYREAQGLTILEAMALSRPVVASNVGGIPEMVEDGVTGLLVPPHDAEALAAAIVRLLTDHPYADMLGRAGHDLVHDRFCIELMVDAVAVDLRRGRPERATVGGRGRLIGAVGGNAAGPVPTSRCGSAPLPASIRG